MNTKKVLFFFFLVIMSSCQIRHVCPEYDMENRLLITFRKNDTIRYYSDNTATIDSLVFYVEDFYRNEPYEFYSSGPDAYCYYDVYYQTNYVEGVFIRDRLNGSNMEVQIGDDVYSFGFGASNLIDTIGSDYRITNSFVMIDDTRCYYWTLQDLSGNRRFDSFTKMENRGIIEFHDKQTGKVWVLDW